MPHRFFDHLGALKTDGQGMHGCLVVNAATDAAPAAGLPEAVAHYRSALVEAFAAALTRSAQAGETGDEHHADRVEVLVGLAVGVNWTARAAGGPAARRLADAARVVVDDWRGEEQTGGRLIHGG